MNRLIGGFLVLVCFLGPSTIFAQNECLSEFARLVSVLPHFQGKTELAQRIKLHAPLRGENLWQGFIRGSEIVISEDVLKVFQPVTLNSINKWGEIDRTAIDFAIRKVRNNPAHSSFDVKVTQTTREVYVPIGRSVYGLEAELKPVIEIDVPNSAAGVEFVDILLHP